MCGVRLECVGCQDARVSSMMIRFFQSRVSWPFGGGPTWTLVSRDFGELFESVSLVWSLVGTSSPSITLVFRPLVESHLRAPACNCVCVASRRRVWVAPDVGELVVSVLQSCDFALWWNCVWPPVGGRRLPRRKVVKAWCICDITSRFVEPFAKVICHA